MLFKMYSFNRTHKKYILLTQYTFKTRSVITQVHVSQKDYNKTVSRK